VAAYPTLPTSYQSDPRPIKGTAIDRAEDGTARVRSYFASDKVSFSIKHEWLSASQKATLDAFYAANRMLTFDYTSPADSVTRTCVFTAPIAYTRRPGNYWDATVEMEQV
jgi:hypothetical protein